MSVGVDVFHEDGFEKADDGVEHVGDVEGAVLEGVSRRLIDVSHHPVSVLKPISDVHINVPAAG